jgi:naphtho-gamma-pyrone polyketide synthase
VGTVILKRLEDAIADKDPIHGVIRGAYTNHCGRADSITRPFEGDQAAVFNRIMRYSGVKPQDVSYVEMHGTGTQAGDATEMKSVLSVFAPDAKRAKPLYLGTAKANIGHAESASGVSSLIKVLMMMKNNAIPPHCGIKTKINQGYPKDMKERNIHIAFAPTAWDASDSAQGKRKAFLNNFSAAGGNTAILLEEAPERSLSLVEQDTRSKQPVTVSAKTAKSLSGNVEALISYLNENPAVSLSSLSYTTTARRIHQNHRVIVSGSDIASIQARLQDLLPNLSEQRPIPPVANRPPVILAFTGQGSVYKSLGKQLMNSAPCFRESMLRLNRLAEQQGFPSFLPLVNGTIDELKQTSPIITQLALVCVQMALTNLWKSLEVAPVAVIGHSLGEYPALYASGVLTAADVVYLVGTRARLLSEKATAGTHAMLAVKLPVSAIKPELEGTSCEIACLNQPSSNVVSGPVEDLAALEHRLKARGAECVLLDVPYAFHSGQVDPILESFQKATASVCYRPPLIPYISPFLSKVIAAGDTDSLSDSYLVNSCRRPVNFQGAIEAARTEKLVDEKCLWIEIGSHPACSGMIKGILGSSSLTIPSLNKNKDSWAVLTSGLETLYSSGIDICWTEYHRGFEQYQEVLPLPRYSWDLKNYWINYRNNFCLTKGDDLVVADTELVTEHRAKPRYLSPSVQMIVEQKDGPENSTIVAESNIHDERLAPILAGHSVNGALLCPSVCTSFTLFILAPPNQKIVSVRRYRTDYHGAPIEERGYGYRKGWIRCR